MTTQDYSMEVKMERLEEKMKEDMAEAMAGVREGMIKLMQAAQEKMMKKMKGRFQSLRMEMEEMDADPRAAEQREVDPRGEVEMEVADEAEEADTTQLDAANNNNSDSSDSNDGGPTEFVGNNVDETKASIQEGMTSVRRHPDDTLVKEEPIDERSTSTGDQRDGAMMELERQKKAEEERKKQIEGQHAASSPMPVTKKAKHGRDTEAKEKANEESMGSNSLQQQSRAEDTKSIAEEVAQSGVRQSSREKKSMRSHTSVTLADAKLPAVLTGTPKNPTESAPMVVTEKTKNRGETEAMEEDNGESAESNDQERSSSEAIESSAKKAADGTTRKSSRTRTVKLPHTPVTQTHAKKSSSALDAKEKKNKEEGVTNDQEQSSSEDTESNAEIDSKGERRRSSRTRNFPSKSKFPRTANHAQPIIDPAEEQNLPAMNETPGDPSKLVHISNLSLLQIAERAAKFLQKLGMTTTPDDVAGCKVRERQELINEAERRKREGKLEGLPNNIIQTIRNAIKNYNVKEAEQKSKKENDEKKEESRPMAPLKRARFASGDSTTQSISNTEEKPKKKMRTEQPEIEMQKKNSVIEKKREEASEMEKEKQRRMAEKKEEERLEKERLEKKEQQRLEEEKKEKQRLEEEKKEKKRTAKKKEQERMEEENKERERLERKTKEAESDEDRPAREQTEEQRYMCMSVMHLEDALFRGYMALTGQTDKLGLLSNLQRQNIPTRGDFLRVCCSSLRMPKVSKDDVKKEERKIRLIYNALDSKKWRIVNE